MIYKKHIEEISNLVTMCYTGLSVEDIQIQETRKEFEGDWTIVLFPILKLIKKPLDQIGDEIGSYLIKELDYLESFNIFKGFLRH